MVSVTMKKGERLICALPAASLLDCMITPTVPMGWITVVAIAPDIEPIKKGLNTNFRRFCAECLV